MAVFIQKALFFFTFSLLGIGLANSHSVAPTTACTAAVSSFSVQVLDFLNAEKPDYEKVQQSVRLLSNIDTSREQFLLDYSKFGQAINAKALELLHLNLDLAQDQSDLQVILNKLRLINSSALRHWLDEPLMAQVGMAVWAYNRILWNDSLSFATKKSNLKIEVEQIRKKPLVLNSQVPRVPGLLNIKVIQGDVLESKLEALVTTIGCQGSCSSEIHSALFPKRIRMNSLKDAEAQTVFAHDTVGKNLVLVVDDQKLPLRFIILSALRQAEKSGFKSVALPAFRTGDAFGSVENSYDQVSHEIAIGLSLFQAETKSTLQDINFVIRNNSKFYRVLTEKVAELFKERERTLRDDLREVVLSGKGYALEAQSKVEILQPDSPIYRTNLVRWSLDHLMKIHAPIKIASLSDKSVLTRPSISVLNMPIKMIGTNFRIPAEFAHLREFLQKIIDYEVSINPTLSTFYAYLTVDYQAVKAGKTHRRGGIHIDGVQGARYKVKMVPEHAYSASNTLGTIFYNQAFDLRKLDPAKQHVHAELERQARPESRIVTDDFDIYLWNSYSVHETNTATHDLERTFVRVEFSQKIYDGIGDTHNPLFDYNWTRVPRPIPEALDDKALGH